MNVPLYHITESISQNLKGEERTEFNRKVDSLAKDKDVYYVIHWLVDWLLNVFKSEDFRAKIQELAPNRHEEIFTVMDEGAAIYREIIEGKTFESDEEKESYIAYCRGVADKANNLQTFMRKAADNGYQVRPLANLCYVVKDAILHRIAHLETDDQEMLEKVTAKEGSLAIARSAPLYMVVKSEMLHKAAADKLIELLEAA